MLYVENERKRLVAFVNLLNLTGLNSLSLHLNATQTSVVQNTHIPTLPCSILKVAVSRKL